MDGVHALAWMENRAHPLGALSSGWRHWPANPIQAAPWHALPCAQTFAKLIAFIPLPACEEGLKNHVPSPPDASPPAGGKGLFAGRRRPAKRPLGRLGRYPRAFFEWMVPIPLLMRDNGLPHPICQVFSGPPRGLAAWRTGLATPRAWPAPDWRRARPAPAANMAQALRPIGGQAGAARLAPPCAGRAAPCLHACRAGVFSSHASHAPRTLRALLAPRPC